MEKSVLYIACYVPLRKKSGYTIYVYTSAYKRKRIDQKITQIVPQ